MAKEKTTDLAKTNVMAYSIIKIGRERMSSLMEANMGDDGIRALDLDRIHVPAGGAAVWEIPTLQGPTHTEGILCVIAGWKKCRLFWKDEFGGGGSPPDCTSEDCMRGVGNPGGSCLTCPNAQWKSHRNGRAQACKMVQQLFVFTPGDNLPMVVNVPPSSLKGCKQYLNQLTRAGHFYWGVVTRLSLHPAKNEDGIKYAEILFAMDHAMTAEESAAFEGISKALRPHLASVKVTEADYPIENE